MTPESAPYIFRNRLLATIAFVLGIAALREAYPLVMPMLFAAIIVAAIWPLKVMFDRWLPSWLSYTLTILALLFVILAFAAAVILSISQVLSVLDSQWPALVAGYNRLAADVAQWGLRLNGAMDQRRIASMATVLAASVYAFVTYLGFIALLIILGISEVPRVGKRLRDELGTGARAEFAKIVSKSAGQVRSYFATILSTSLLTGVASAGFSFAVGLDLALVWGLLNFLLNFVPVIGNFIGIVPPVLYAFIQFGGYTMPLIVLAGFAILQVVISNFVYPLLQGRQLSLSPVAIIVALAFWTWIWGIAGALLAVPLTAATVILCRQFERTHWIAALIARD